MKRTMDDRKYYEFSISSKTEIKVLNYMLTSKIRQGITMYSQSNPQEGG